MWTWLLLALAAALLIRFLSGRRDSSPESRSSTSQTEAAPNPDDLEPVVLPIEAFIDLHAFSPQDIPDVVESYLEAAQNKGFAEVRLIHGRGKGVQRDRFAACSLAIPASSTSATPLRKEADGGPHWSSWRERIDSSAAQKDGTTGHPDNVSRRLRDRLAILPRSVQRKAARRDLRSWDCAAR